MQMTRALDALAVAFAFGGMFFWTGGLVAFLITPGAPSSPAVQAVAALIGMISGLLLLMHPRWIAVILGSYWLPLLPLAYAAVTILWSADPALSIKRVIALSLTTVYAYWFAMRFSGRDVVRIVYWVVVVGVVANFLNVIVNPTMGIHQATDLEAAHHFGSWRGLYSHKNEFGRFIAFCICILVLGLFEGMGSRRWRWLSLSLILLCFYMIAMSKSSQAVLLGVVIPAAYLFLRMIKQLSPLSRAASVTAAIPASIVLLSLAQVIFEVTLLALGRDTTLTGRTEIWRGTFEALGSGMTAGLGFGAGWEVVGERLYVQSGVLLGHAHNGYIDLVVDVGLIGTALAVLLIFYVFYQGFVALMLGRETEIASLAIIVTLFIIVGNLAGSFLMLHNSFHWVLPITCYVILLRSRARAHEWAASSRLPVGEPVR